MPSNLADYNSTPVRVASGDGCYLFDEDGRKYVDFLAGWCVANIGYKHPEAVRALKEEAERGTYVPPLLQFGPWDEFAKTLVDIAPGNKLARVFRCTSGSEAVEFAIKCARAATGKSKIVSVSHVYHGHTYGAASVGNACFPGMGPCLPDCVKIDMPNPYRGADTAGILKDLEKLFKKGDVAAFLSEPVWTNAGVIVPPAGFYPALQELCVKYGVLLVMDEVATGFGRCGRLFASELWNLWPDILCLGKGLTGGYGTLGATLVSEEIYKKSAPIPYYSTFGWMPIDLAGAMANVRVILENKLWENSGETGEYLLAKLKPFEKLPFVGQVRGTGLLLGIEIVTDKVSQIPDIGLAVRIQDECVRQGLILDTAYNTLFITPPLILTRDIADKGFAILESVLENL